MSGVFKSTKTTVLVVLLVIVLTISAISAVGCSLIKKKLTYNNELGAVASNKVANAQYMPDINKFIKANASKASQAVSLASEDGAETSEDQSKMTLDEFSELVDKCGNVCNYAGAGKYYGYDIYDIKNEIAYVIKNVPVFNQWFRMPTMRENEGYIAIPYYESWAYFLELSIEPLKLSITRVCWSTRCAYYDFEKGVEVEDYDDDTSFIQYEVMKINYYTDNTGSEVVESSLFAVGVDHAKSGAKYNSNKKDSYPFEYQYLKNVKDKSLTKYHITAAERRDKGMDIRGLTPYGIEREFLEINYDGYVNIDVTEIDQRFKSERYPDADGAVDFDLKSNNIQNLVKTIGMDQNAYESAKTPNELMDAMSKHIVDNFELKNNWQQIFKESAKATTLETIPGPFYGQPLDISYIRSRLDIFCRNYYDGSQEVQINYDCSAIVNNEDILADGTLYSLSLAFVSGNDIYIIGSDYRQPDVPGEPYATTIASYLDYIAFPEIKIDKDGEYLLTVVITKQVDGEDVIVLDTKEPALLLRYEKFNIPNYTDENGVTHTYIASGVGGKFIIRALTIED